jgi:hypothetical protein
MDTPPTWVAEDYRWYDDDGAPEAATPLGNENTAIGISPGDKIRLRVNAGETAGAAGTGLHTGGWTLQFKVDSGSFTTVGAATDVRYFDSTNMTNGTAIPITDFVLNWSGAGVARAWGDECEDGLSASNGDWASDNCEIEYTVDFFNVNPGEQITFRLIAPDGTSAVTFTNVPTVDVVAIVKPGVGSLDIGEQTPTPSVNTTLTPSYGQLRLIRWIGLMLDGHTPTVTTTAGGADITEEPLVGSLALTGAAPTLSWGVAATAGSIALDGSAAPTRVVNIIVQPSTGALALTGETPSAEEAHDSLVTVGSLDIASAGDPVRIVNFIRGPPVDELQLAAAAPSAEIEHNRSVGVSSTKWRYTKRRDRPQ